MFITNNKTEKTSACQCSFRGLWPQRPRPPGRPGPRSSPQRESRRHRELCERLQTSLPRAHPHCRYAFKSSSYTKILLKVFLFSFLQLRYLQTLNSIAAEHNSTIIFPMPMNIMDHFMGSSTMGGSSTKRPESPI